MAITVPLQRKYRQALLESVSALGNAPGRSHIRFSLFLICYLLNLLYIALKRTCGHQDDVPLDSIVHCLSNKPFGIQN